MSNPVRSNVSAYLQPSSIQSILLTLLVSNEDKSSSVKEVQPKNISSIYSTLLVSIEERSIDANDLQFSNKLFIYMTLLVLHNLIDFNEEQLLNIEPISTRLMVFEGSLTLVSAQQSRNIALAYKRLCKSSNDKSMLFNNKHLSNILRIVFTLLVSNIEMSMLVSDEQPKNILSIDSTLLVLSVDMSMNLSDVQPANISESVVAFDVSNFDVNDSFFMRTFRGNDFIGIYSPSKTTSPAVVHFNSS